MIKRNIVKLVIFISLSLFFYGCKNSDCILIVGDSLFYGYGLREECAPVKIIEKNIHRKSIDFCEPGLTVSAFSKRLSQYDEIKISHVIIELGGNDFLLNRNINETMQSFFELINYFKRKEAAICIVSFIDSGMFEYSNYCDADLLHQYEEMYNSLLENDILVIKNVWENLFYDSGYKSDFFHPNEIGAKIISERVLKKIDQSGFLK